MRRTTAKLLQATLVALQGGGWGSAASGDGGGGWGGAGGGGGGGWGGAAKQSPPASGGWGDAGGGGGSGGGGWGNSGGGGGGGGGWGSSGDGGGGGGGGGWGNSGGGRRRQGGGGWGDGDAGWGGAPTGQQQQRGSGGWGNRGGPRQNRPPNRSSGGGGGWGGGGGGAGVWGEPKTVDEEAWRAAPPSFSPPVRRVDPLTLTAVEVEIDGVRKLVGQRVQITGLADETTWHTLKDHLRQAGEVTFCKTYPNGRAMVEFATPEDAARTITELQGSELQGATLFLREDREDIVLVNTRRKIREAREAQLRARKEEAERLKREQAIAEGDRPDAPPQA